MYLKFLETIETILDTEVALVYAGARCTTLQRNEGQHSGLKRTKLQLSLVFTDYRNQEFSERMWHVTHIIQIKGQKHEHFILLSLKLNHYGFCVNVTFKFDTLK